MSNKLNPMYFTYFGLSEAPFSIAPDPAYLYMSDRHREALAHLSHGLGDNGGFVLLTGEVGTGKTTISRSVMENLPDNTQSAFILNPTLSCEELLATICDELSIRYKKSGATLKYLTDKIQQKLISNHQTGINTLLIIDEAQHLQPQVLEQLRLLTNLETNTKKLLQVILIGQPELQQLLQRRDLRQLAQRITARYHLLPLTKAEIAQYIQHRLSVANCVRTLFNKSAVAELHRISKGIPRVINLLADRALMLAYNQNASVVNGKIVKRAAVEALGNEQTQVFWQKPVFQGVAAGVTICLLALSGYWLGYRFYLMPSEDNLVQALPVEQTTASDISAKEQQTASTQTVIEQTAANAELDQGLAARLDEISQQLASLKASDGNQINLMSEDSAETESIKDGKTQIEQPAQQQPKILGYQPERVTQQANGEYELVATQGVSEELLARFKDAVNETRVEDQPDEHKSITEYNEQQALKALHQMPAQIQDRLPSLQFDMHMFATEGQGWVRVNGQDKREGEEIAQGVILAAILPQQVVLEFEQQRFTMPALSSW